MRGDILYIEERNKLIPQAERIANQKCGCDYHGAKMRDRRRNPDREEWVADWNRAFSDAMNELARKAGL